MARLGDICKLVSGNSLPDTIVAEKGELPYVKVAELNLSENTPNITTSRQFVSIKDISAKQIVPVGTVIFPKRGGAIGTNKKRLVSTPICMDLNLMGVIPSSKIYPQYLYYFFENIDMGALSNGSSVPQINNSDIAPLEIRIPDIAKQKDMAVRLDKVSELIALRKEQLTKLDQLVKSRFIELFGDCLTNPKGWKTKHLEDIAEVGSSKRVFVEDLKETGIPFYRGTEVGALAEGKPIKPELFITEEHYSELCEATGTPRIGDLLMPSICPDGRIWVVNSDEPFYFKDGRVLWVHNIDASYNSIFLLYTLKDRIMTDYSSIASGTTFAELKIFALKKCRIFDVPLAMQNEFATYIKQTDKSKLAIQQSLDKLELMKKALIQEYFE